MTVFFCTLSDGLGEVVREDRAFGHVWLTNIYDFIVPAVKTTAKRDFETYIFTRTYTSLPANRWRYYYASRVHMYIIYMYIYDVRLLLCRTSHDSSPREHIIFVNWQTWYLFRPGRYINTIFRQTFQLFDVISLYMLYILRFQTFPIMFYSFWKICFVDVFRSFSFFERLTFSPFVIRIENKNK